MPFDQALQNQLNQALINHSTPVFPTSFRDVAEGFKEKFGRSWTKELANQVGTSQRTVQRWASFEGLARGKETRNPARASSANKEAIVKAGQQLPPIARAAPREGITLTLSGNQREANRERPREFKVHMNHGTAQQYVSRGMSVGDLMDEMFGDDGLDWPAAEETLFGEADTGTLDEVTIA